MMLGLSLALPAVRRAGGLVLFAPAIGDSLTLASLGVPESGRGTYIFKGTLDATATGTPQTFFQIDSGATTNRYMCRAASGSVATQAVRTTAGAAATVSSGNVTAATLFAYGLSVDGAGGALATLNGGTVATVTGGPTSGLTTLRIGTGVSAADPFVGTIALVRVLAGVVLADADLRAEVSAT